MAGAECEASVNGLFAGARLIGGAGARFPASGHDSSGPVGTLEAALSIIR